MKRLTAFWTSLCAGLDRLAPEALPLLARFVFAAVLLSYFWTSAATKLGEGLFSPALGAYAQIFPKMLEAAGYDPGALGTGAWLVVVLGTLAEFVLPALIVLGLATRLAAAGMIGFVLVQSLTDIWGHMAGPETIGRWFDAASDSLILDQRAFWLLALTVLLLQGAGRLSLDRLAARLAKVS